MSVGPAGEDTPVLQLVHHHPGRLRLRSEAFQDGEALAGRAREALLALGPVRRVEHDPGTGSLLVEYRPGTVDPDAILACVAEAAGLRSDLDGPRRPDRTHGERLVGVCRELNEAAYEVTGFRVEPRTLAPIGVAALSAVFFALNKGQRMPRWDNLAYWSLSLFAMFHGREIQQAARSFQGPERGGAPRPDGQAPR